MVQARHIQRGALFHIAYRVFEFGEYRRALLCRNVGHMKTEEMWLNATTAAMALNSLG